MMDTQELAARKARQDRIPDALARCAISDVVVRTYLGHYIVGTLGWEAMLCDCILKLSEIRIDTARDLMREIMNSSTQPSREIIR